MHAKFRYPGFAYEAALCLFDSKGRLLSCRCEKLGLFKCRICLCLRDAPKMCPRMCGFRMTCVGGRRYCNFTEKVVDGGVPICSLDFVCGHVLRKQLLLQVVVSWLWMNPMQLVACAWPLSVSTTQKSIAKHTGNCCVPLQALESMCLEPSYSRKLSTSQQPMASSWLTV